MADMCDIKTYANAGQWTAAKDVYQNGKNAPKSDGSYRTLAGFAAATGKQHNYDSYYGMNGAIDAHIMAALDGTGDFENTSDTVRYQGVAKLTANMAMVAYTIHELNTAVNKAEDGNWENNDSGAPHNWDEGWAFFHGPDENVGCGPVSTLNKRANDFGTKTTTSFGDVANTTHAITDAMVGGLAALQTNDSTGYNDAAGVVVTSAAAPAATGRAHMRDLLLLEGDCEDAVGSRAERIAPCGCCCAMFAATAEELKSP